MTFVWTIGTLIISVIVLIIAAVCCFISWRRSGYRRSMLWLELFRFVLITLVLITLNQPEFTQEIKPQEHPTLVVMHDVSGSMKTQDVINPKTPAEKPVTREAAVAPVIEPELWTALTGRMNVVFEPFSSQPPTGEKGTDLNSALQSVGDKHANLRGVVLLSDGDWNIGQAPGTASSALRVKNVPVYAVGVGSEERLPDMELAASDAPTFGVVNKSLRIPFRIISWLPADRDVKVSLTGTRGEKSEKTVRVSGMGQQQDTIDWKPEKTGEYELTLEIPVDDSETLPDNNRLKIPITIRDEELKVLVVESYPRWEYRYLRNALERDPGVAVSCLLFHPDIDSVGGGRGYLEQFPTEKELFEYDVVFLGDVGIGAKQLTPQDCTNLKQLVRSQAGGLVFLPGFRGYQNSLQTSELDELNPVVLDQTHPKGYGASRPARFTLTEAGRRSLLTRLEPDDNDNERVWNSLPGFQWYAAAQRAKIGSQVLATHDSDSTSFGRVPLIATRTVGTGKVLFMGTDGAWRWRKGVEDLYHYRFWGQVVRWMAYQRNMSQGESMRLFYSPDRPEAGNVVTLNANVMSTAGDPLRTGTVIVQTVSPSGQTDSIRLAPAGEDSWGLFTGTFTPTEGGQYKFVTTCTETGARLETIIAVLGQEKELIGQPARLDVLKEIAQMTRGQLTTVSEIQGLVDHIAAMPEPEPILRRFRLWSHPAWGGLIVILLGGFWTGRKLAGLA
ncbi:MAG TPA: VWA domain-containing protein [Planctomycetaceae bacterium]|nr:VWA domain-containing protein [Planctomycetaceae bacterium]